MKKVYIWIAVLAFVYGCSMPFHAQAAESPINFNFSGVSLVQFGQATFKNILRRNFVISPQVVAMDKKITVVVDGVMPSKVAQLVEGILSREGIVTTLRDGVYYLDPVPSSQAVLAPLQAVMPSPGYHHADLSSHAFQRPFDAIARPVSPVLVGGNVQDAPVSQGSSVVPLVELVVVVYVPVARPAEFLADVVIAVFGPRSAGVAGANVVLSGTQVQVDKMRVLAGAVDVLPMLVDVSASWIEVTDSVSAGRGISVVADVLGAKLGVKVGVVGSSPMLSVRSSKFEVVMDALNSDGRFKQVSNSRIVGDDYERMSLTVGDETPTVASSGKDNVGNPVQSIVYRPSGVILNVLPKVLGGGRIKLGVDGQISSFKATSTGVSGSPTLIKREVKTVVTVGDGEVLLIGGLNDSQDGSNKSGFPFLPTSWSLNSSSKVKTDLVLVLSAKVVKN